VSKIHEWIHWFEKNDYLKRHKLFRNMNDKLGFYKKLEIPLLQDAYLRLSNFLRQNDRLADRGEFSILNTSQANFFNKSRVSMNRSVFSNKNQSMQDDLGYNMNILDELNNDGNLINFKRDSLPEILSKITEKLTTEPLTTMSPMAVNDSIKKLQVLIGKFIRQSQRQCSDYIDGPEEQRRRQCNGPEQATRKLPAQKSGVLHRLSGRTSGQAKVPRNSVVNDEHRVQKSRHCRGGSRRQKVSGTFGEKP
jgi:hypothetical protein